MLNVACGCGDTLDLPEEMVGEAVDCPSCGQILHIVSGPNSNAVDADSYPVVSITAGPTRVGEQFVLTGDAPIEIGKLPDRPISLLGTRVSRIHCRLLHRDGRWLIEDNKSTNGVFVNNKRVTQPLALRDGDTLIVGDFTLEFHDSSAVAVPTAAAPASASGGIDLDDIDDSYDVAEEEQVARVPVAAAGGKAAPVLGADAIACPSCRTKYAPTTQLCVNCGINIKTGRAILITREVDENALAIRAENMLRVFSWVARIGVYPISSDGHGTKKPIVTWGLAAAIAIATIGVWVGTLTHTMSGPNNMMLWAGRTPNAQDIEIARLAAYDAADDESDVAPSDKSDESASSADNADESDDEPAGKPRVNTHASIHVPQMPPKTAIVVNREPKVALNAEAFFGSYAWTQLITNGFLHGSLTRWSIFQLIRNLVFLTVFGSAVNALIGNIRMGILYTLVLISASLAFVSIQAGGPPTFTSGANGAVMGLAGAYVVLFPIHKMHIVAWRRKGIRSGFELAMKIFQVRGVWVVLCCVALDILMTLLITRGGTDWIAHVWGFGAGMACAIILLIARQADANRTDMISLLLGRNSWALLGKPGSAPAAE